MDEWIRLVVRQELVVPVVFGTFDLKCYDEPDAKKDTRVEARRMSFNLQLRALCDCLHVACDAPVALGEGVPRGKQYLAQDGMHPNAEAQRLIAEAEYPYYRHAWQLLRSAEWLVPQGKPPVCALPGPPSSRTSGDSRPSSRRPAWNI